MSADQDRADRDLAAGARWRGAPGRLEVHYLTATDDATGTALWLHHEVVAPVDGDAYGHGWLATFPIDGAPSYERWGPNTVSPVTGDLLYRCSDVELTRTRAVGKAGDRSWDLSIDEAQQRPLWTFPRWVWRRQVLPAAQVLPAPAARITGTVDDQSYAATAGLAHIYRHCNAHRWGWLHCPLGEGPLGGDDVLEVVAAVGRRPGLRMLPPLPLLQLRVDGEDWPGDALAVAPLFRARIDDSSFRITGIVGRRRLRVDVELPPDRCVVLGYTDPDGATATCTNTERADARITLDRLGPRGWTRERSWELTGTAHAEIGRRP
jgi:hypothetical protein